jgi:hypothetical protein
MRNTFPQVRLRNWAMTRTFALDPFGRTEQTKSSTEMADISKPAPSKDEVGWLFVQVEKQKNIR